MECIVANVDNMRFDIEVALDEQYGALPLPFTGMDSAYLCYVKYIRIGYNRLILFITTAYFSPRLCYFNLRICRMCTEQCSIDITSVLSGGLKKKSL